LLQPVSGKVSGMEIRAAARQDASARNLPADLADPGNRNIMSVIGAPSPTAARRHIGAPQPYDNTAIKADNRPGLRRES
ncbi:MAG TPA: hypothetical protein VGV62_09515, partial [Xanthobacteraceae bacterium]|nr:hypothetical protein [Xanthobacteraceae bacterium]